MIYLTINCAILEVKRSIDKFDFVHQVKTWRPTCLFVFVCVYAPDVYYKWWAGSGWVRDQTHLVVGSGSGLVRAKPDPNPSLYITQLCFVTSPDFCPPQKWITQLCFVTSPDFCPPQKWLTVEWINRQNFEMQPLICQVFVHPDSKTLKLDHKV